MDLAGKHIVFTVCFFERIINFHSIFWRYCCDQGTFAAGVRRIVESQAENLGVRVMVAVTSNTDFVVVGSLVNGGHTKEVRANELNIPLIPEDEWDDIVASFKAAKVDAIHIDYKLNFTDIIW